MFDEFCSATRTCGPRFSHILHAQPSRSCSAAPLCQNVEMALQTPPARPNGVDRHAILRGKRLGFGGFGMGGTQALAACLHATPHPVGLPGRWTRAGTRSPGTGTWFAFPFPRELELGVFSNYPASFASRASERSERARRAKLAPFVPLGWQSLNLA